MWNLSPRVLKALRRAGLAVEINGAVLRIFDCNRPPCSTPVPEVLLPEGHRLDTKALKQLVDFASTHHPQGGVVLKALATPDFHAGSGVPVGCVLVTSPELVIPDAIGTDINCGMRLHAVDLTLSELNAQRDVWLPALRSDLLLGTRDLPMTVRQIRALLRGGPLAWIEAVRRQPLGLLAQSRLGELEGELEKSYGLGSYDGDENLVADYWKDAARDLIRDPYLGTIGGGNHFVEIQVVDRILDRRLAHAWGLKEGRIAVMAHSGSRAIGLSVGTRWREKARALWPRDMAHPDSGIFPVHGEAAVSYITAMNTAANYAAVNRLLLLEMVRIRFRQTFGEDLAMPLIFDVPHNIITCEHSRFVHRKGATPAEAGQPVLIPGLMGHPSYVMVGLGNDDYLQSASHGAGRKYSRGHMHRRAKHGHDLGLDTIECITLKQERLVQEAPAAYKDIDEVVDIQARVGIVSPVARLRPVLTFKS